MRRNMPAGNGRSTLRKCMPLTQPAAYRVQTSTSRPTIRQPAPMRSRSNTRNASNAKNSRVILFSSYNWGITIIYSPAPCPDSNSRTSPVLQDRSRPLPPAGEPHHRAPKGRRSLRLGEACIQECPAFFLPGSSWASCLRLFYEDVGQILHKRCTLSSTR
ncbi:hypothetical protein B0H12DRAFT_373529 [Mycena haematopus]|nr:hypothetical protein B0H12DRAFT_373529 [Mycena haematopus]